MPRSRDRDDKRGLRPRTDRKRKAESSPTAKAHKSKKAEPEEEVDLDFTTREVRPYERPSTRGLVITELANVPSDWNWTDYDIPEDDIEANIQRCKDRIEDGIMPQWWQNKLVYLEEDRAAIQRMIASEPEGLDLAVVARLKTLEFIQKSLVKKGDEYNQMKNVKAIMKHYREQSSTGFTWNYGKVTYWADGAPISEVPEVFDWKRFRKLSDIYLDECRSAKNPNPQTGIWVEGGQNPGPHMSMVVWPVPRYIGIPSPGFGRAQKYNLSLRIPGSARQMEWTFTDDTGCSKTLIYKDDLERLLQISNGRRPLFLDESVYITANGNITTPTVELECCLTSGTTEFTPWVATEISIANYRRPAGVPRLAGPFIREMVYTATAPDGLSRLYIAKNKTVLTRAPFPSVDLDQATVPVQTVPVPGDAPGAQWRNLMRVINTIPPPPPM
ncbi:hypothetical protein N7456_009422 [Penicillium angulare]|uniref:Uncharacterized protein n=1 Tax=Penicillium angulare TaxID=116970 RepID=A0A9W9F4R4_9EURO|nr:hypothetical protein N7456_009422 [Penicillium angulare]